MKKIAYPKLGKVETSIYVVLWLSSYITAVWQVYILSKEYVPVGLKEGHLQIGYNYFTSKFIYDKSDYEWEMWNHFFINIVIYAFIGHFMVLRTFEAFFANIRFNISMVYTFCFCWYYFGISGLLCIVFESFLVFSVSYLTCSIILTWLTSIFFIVTLHTDLVYYWLSIMLRDQNFLVVLFVCTCSMCNLRYTSFCIEHIWRKKREMNGAKVKSSNHVKIQTFISSFYELLLYQFYFPLFVGGPVVNYNIFKDQMENNISVKWTANVFIKFVVGTFRYIILQLIINLSLYYFHFSAIHAHVHLIEKVPILTLCGLALCFVQFFSMKYMIIYGLPHYFATSDNLKVPGGSHCVSGKHRFTDMWKDFDKGLHKWLVRYIYIPSGGISPHFLRKSWSSALPFIFVYIWHGLQNYHLVWAALNWLGIYIEKISEAIYENPKVRKFEEMYIHPMWSRRIRAFLSSFLFSLLIVSNIYFLAGVEIGNIYIKRVYTEGFSKFLFIHVALYCGVQTSMEISRIRESIPV